MDDIDECDYEVDQKVFQSKEMGDLGHVRNFLEALNKYGYNADDNISRRDVVVIYQKTKRDLTTMMNKHSGRGSYDLAVEWKQRLASLRADFDDRLRMIITSNINIEHQQFDVAKTNLLRKQHDDHDSRKQQVASCSHQKEIEHQETYRVKWEILEENINAMKISRVKYSPRMIELVNSEAHLNKLTRFDEARRVRAMIDKLKPIEDRAHTQEYQKQINTMRSNLQQEEDRDRKKLEMMLKTIEWKDIRQRQHDRTITQHRFDNHHHDMNHSHKHELHLRPETSLQPSALWSKRKGHHETSSFHRGRQLLCVSKGVDISGQGELADTLLDKHSFSNPLDGTTMIR